MTTASVNPFENNVTELRGRAAVQGNGAVDAADLPDDPETGEPPEIHGDGSGEKLPPGDDTLKETVDGKTTVSKSRSAKSGPAQLQPPTDDQPVEPKSTGEKPEDKGSDEVVDAEIVDETASEDEPVDAATAEAVEVWQPPPFPSIEADWPHETIEYGGFKLGIRVPTGQALTGFTMGTGQYVPDMVKQNMVSMFVHRHFSPQSYAFLMMRLMDPDATDFNEETFGEIVRRLVELSGEKVVAEMNAKAEAEKKARKKGKR
jgi:hypothetical protein